MRQIYNTYIKKSVHKQFNKLNLKTMILYHSVPLYRKTDARGAQFLIPFSKQS